MTWADSLIRSEAQQRKKCGLVVVSWKDFFYFFYEKR